MRCIGRKPQADIRNWLALAWIVCAVWVLVPPLAAAQDAALVVVLRDPADQGIAGITIMVRGSDGQELARELTDLDGTARFADLPAIVRVAVDGQPKGGPHLYQLGDDAQGVRLALGVGDSSVVLHLRAERDGLVLPDPATMLSLEVGGPTVAPAPTLPTPAIATPGLLPTRIDPRAPAILVVGVSPDPAPPAPWWAPVVVLLAIAGALLGLLALRWRRAHP